MQHLLGIDIGTSSVKASIIDANAALLASAAIPYRILSEKPEYREVDAPDMWRAVLKAIERLGEATCLGDVAAIGVSCLCPGLTAFDADGNVLFNPIIYSDQRSVREAEYIKQAMEKSNAFALTANLPLPGAMSSTSMLWIKNNRPDIFARIRCFGHINTLMGLLLTGNYGIDPSNASYTLLFETTGRRLWNDEFCRAIGIPSEKLPPLFRSHEIIGPLINPSVIELGIKAGTPVVMGGGDTACAALASGIISDKDVCDSIGTTDVLTVCVDKPVFRPEFVNRCHVVEGKWIYQCAMSHVGSSLEWCKNILAPDLVAVSKDPYVALSARASGLSRPGANGVVFLPYMMGERAPICDPFARGVFFGLTLNSTREDMLRAVLESACYGCRQNMALCEELTGWPIRAFSAIGGAAKNDIWMQMKADITGAVITSLEVKDMAAIGAALLSGIGIGLFKDARDASARVKRDIYKTFYPSDKDAAAYERNYKTYIALYPQLKEIYRAHILGR